MRVLSFQPLRRSPGHKTRGEDKRPSQWSLNRRSLCKLKEAEGVILDSDDNMFGVQGTLFMCDLGQVDV